MEEVEGDEFLYRELKNSENSEKRKEELLKNAQELIDYRKAMVDTDFGTFEEVQEHLNQSRLDQMKRRREARSAKRKVLAEQNDQ